MAFSVPEGASGLPWPRWERCPGWSQEAPGLGRHALRGTGPAGFGWLGLGAGLGLAGFLKLIYFLRLVGLGWLALAWLGFGWAWLWLAFTRILLGFGLDFCIFACLS